MNENYLQDHLTGKVFIDDSFMSMSVNDRYPYLNFERDLKFCLTREYLPMTIPKGAWGSPIAKYNIDLMKRLRSYVQRECQNSYYNDVGTIWNTITKSHQYLIKSLINNNLEQAHEYLNVMHLQPAMSGITFGDVAAYACYFYPYVADKKLSRDWDVLVGLCEFLGIIHVYNPEQGISNNFIDVDTLVSFVRDYYFSEFKAPKWQGGLYGLDTSLGIFSDRDLMAFFIANKIDSYVFSLSGFNHGLAEIGPGAGYVVYWLNKLGHKKITTVDLLVPTICQAYQYAANIGDDSFLLPGEQGEAPIQMMSPTDFHSINKKYDIVYNVDSMPEMKPEYCEQYLDTISRTSKMFFSINHETVTPRCNQPSVSHTIFEKNNKDFYRLHRSPFWLRSGYVEEMYMATESIKKA